MGHQYSTFVIGCLAASLPSQFFLGGLFSFWLSCDFLSSMQSWHWCSRGGRQAISLSIELTWLRPCICTSYTTKHMLRCLGLMAVPNYALLPLKSGSRGSAVSMMSRTQQQWNACFVDSCTTSTTMSQAMGGRQQGCCTWRKKQWHHPWTICSALESQTISFLWGKMGFYSQYLCHHLCHAVSCILCRFRQHILILL